MKEYTLRKDNSVKVTTSEVRRDRLLSQGYTEATSKTAKKAEEPKGNQ